MNAENFKNPQPLNRPAPFWSWNDLLDADELKRQIHEMADKGWGSYFCHSRVGLVTGYLSDEWMELIRVCAEEAKATNTYVWLYDEDKWPSGYAGGEVSKFEAYRNRKLVLITEDMLTETDTVLTKHTYNDTEFLICKRVLPLGDGWCNGGCYTDMMNPEAVKYFIECTHEKYKKACGEYFGKEIKGIFTDEPRYIMKTHYKARKDNLPPFIPWSDWIPDYFRKLKGYSIEEHLTELFFNVGDYNKTRFDFFDTATRLFVESFTKQYSEWCKNNNLIMTGHYVSEDSLSGQLSQAGAVMPHYEHMQWPGVDKLSRNIAQHMTCKQLSSVTDQLQKERAICETFAAIGQQSSFFTRKWIGDWMAALGINFFNYHLSLYSMRGERKRDYPPNFFYQQPWWENEEAYSNYNARLGYAMSQGKRNVDILVIHSIASAWSVHTPFRPERTETADFNGHLNALTYDLSANKLDYHFGDEIIMENNAKLQDGKLYIGQHAYSAVIIPPSFTLRDTTFKLLKEFAEQSPENKLIVMSPSPERIDGAKNDIKWPAGTIFAQSRDEVIELLDKSYPDRIKITDSATGENIRMVLCHERITEDGTVIFISNTDDKNSADALITLDGIQKPIALDLLTGDNVSIPYECKDGKTYIRASFDPAGSILLYLPLKDMECSRKAAYLDSGVEFEAEYKLIHKVNPSGSVMLEGNVIPLDKVTLYINGNKVMENEPVAKAWHRYFYKAPDGTPFRAEYKFDAVNVPKGEIFVAMEVAENLDRITLNGAEAKPLKARGEMGAFDPSKNWKDLNFTKVPLNGLVQEGTNTLVIEGKKINNIIGTGYHSVVEDFKNHRATEVETAYLVGNFVVRGKNGSSLYIDGNVSQPNPYDVSTTGYPFYAGSMEAIYDVDVTDDMKDAGYLKVNNVNAACIELYVNGVYTGLKLWKPFIFDIKDLLLNGRNEIKVKAATTLFNLMGPNKYEGALETLHTGPGTFTNMDAYVDKYTLVPFGTGSVEIMK